ncbi:MAG: bifunctional 5,10-methylenetetrahydrofolate dehydrogenase/5,10-methenyltetrahydrofolate cyclohydrolase [Clostridiales bacterium]|nr:bifunctional 5,10-methylenetetrahydrofolate dehydrogenase/5,10-methenyltetrahydrofolate cyclohydrolase [Clostridiales bacterium]
MSARQLLGKPCAEAIYAEVRKRLANKTAKLVAVGFDEERWNQYCNSLSKSAANVGIICEQVILDSKVTPSEFAEAVTKVCKDGSVAGVMVQQPLPKEYADVIHCIDVNKDVDCLNPLSVARLYQGADGFRPATPQAVLRLLDYYGVDLQGKNVVIIGRGNTVGKPLMLMALQRNATVTVCHTKTRNLPQICRNADVVISACGVSNLVTGDFVTGNSIVIDVGLSFSNGKTCGDVASEVYDKCQALSPVPGGVGPVTRAVLFENLVKALNKYQ